MSGYIYQKPNNNNNNRGIKRNPNTIEVKP